MAFESADYDGEEHLIASAITDDGEILPPQFFFKLIELDCTHKDSKPLNSQESLIKDDYENQLTQYMDNEEAKTNEYVDYEINKYEMWAEDQLVPLKKEVMELSREYDSLRRQIRKEHNAAAKLQLKKEENQKGRLLNQKRAKLFEMEDEYADRVDKMTEKLQMAMKNTFSSSVMFRFRWSII